MASNIDDFTVACEVGDLAWIKRCLRGTIDVRERNSEVSTADVWKYVYAVIPKHHSLICFVCGLS